MVEFLFLLPVKLSTSFLILKNIEEKQQNRKKTLLMISFQASDKHIKASTLNDNMWPWAVIGQPFNDNEQSRLPNKTMQKWDAFSNFIGLLNATNTD